MHDFDTFFFKYRKKYQRRKGAILIRKYRLLSMLFYHCDIPLNTQIADTVHFGHNAIGVVINSGCRIGDACQIMQNVTIGAKDGKYPVIEDHVLISAGAVILGGITIGRGSVVGANAVVLKDIPPYTVYAGVPARMVKAIENGDSFPYVKGTERRTNGRQKVE